jgi:hypothetical protein
VRVFNKISCLACFYADKNDEKRLKTNSFTEPAKI